MLWRLANKADVCCLFSAFGIAANFVGDDFIDDWAFLPGSEISDMNKDLFTASVLDDKTVAFVVLPFNQFALEAHGGLQLKS